MSWLSRVITVVVLVAVVVCVALLIRSKMPTTQVGQKFRVCALFRDGTRLATGSPVMIAGVRVGEISQLSIENHLARIDMVLVDNVEIPIDSWVTKRAFSPFGDSIIEIIPGGTEGASTGLRLSSGQCLNRVIEGASTDSVLRSITSSMDPFDQGLDRLHEVSLNGRKWAKGTLEDGLRNVDKWLDEGHIDRPLDRANRAMATMESAATGAADSVAGARPDVDRTLDRVDDGVVSARKRMAELKAGLQEGLKNTREGLNRIDQPVNDFNELVAAIDEGRGNDGKGKLGRLINDPSVGDSIEEATEGARDGLSTFTRFKSWMGLRVEWNVFAAQPRFYVTTEFRSRDGEKFFLVELEKGPLGSYDQDQLTDAVGVPDYTRHQEIKDAIRFTAQFGKTIGNWFQVRGGLKESTFGFGADVLLQKGRLKLSADVFGSFQPTPRLKLAGALAVFRSVYLIAGIDDVLNDPGYLNIVKGNTNVPTQFEQVRYGRDYFLGATLQFDDADLAMLLRLYGAFIVGLML